MTCEICGREKWTVERAADGACRRLGNDYATACYRLGYEIQKARADKAEIDMTEFQCLASSVGAELRSTPEQVAAVFFAEWPVNSPERAACTDAIRFRDARILTRRA